jgi:anti-anti-sigma factor
MTSNRVSRRTKNAEVQQPSGGKPVLAGSPERAKNVVVHLGDCSSAEEFRAEALLAAADGDITLDLDTLDFLDASTLQVLLAVSAGQTNRGRQLQYANTSPAMLQWLEWTGAAPHLGTLEKRNGND